MNDIIFISDLVICFLLDSTDDVEMAIREPKTVFKKTNDNGRIQEGKVRAGRPRDETLRRVISPSHSASRSNL
jgi:hypothetical protein